MTVGTDVLAEDWKLKVSITRPDVAKVYRFLRDHDGPVDVAQISAACFPLTFGSLEPLYRRLFRKSVAKTLLSIGYMRSQGVRIDCVSTPGSLSLFVLVADDV